MGSVDFKYPATLVQCSIIASVPGPCLSYQESYNTIYFMLVHIFLLIH